MLDKAAALSRILPLLDQWGRDVKGGLALLEEMTLDKPYGWVFFYNSRRYVETRNVMQSVAGNGPVVVLAATGEIVRLGSARRPEEEIALFERARGLLQDQ